MLSPRKCLPLERSCAFQSNVLLPSQSTCYHPLIVRAITPPSFVLSPQPKMHFVAQNKDIAEPKQFSKLNL